MPDPPGFVAWTLLYKIGVKKPTLITQSITWQPSSNCAIRRKHLNDCRFEFRFYCRYAHVARYPELTKRSRWRCQSLSALAHHDDFTFSRRRHMLAGRLFNEVSVLPLAGLPFHTHTALTRGAVTLRDEPIMPAQLALAVPDQYGGSRRHQRSSIYDNGTSPISNGSYRQISPADPACPRVTSPPPRMQTLFRQHLVEQQNLRVISRSRQHRV